MRSLSRWLLLACCLALVLPEVRATHIIGGQLEMTPASGRAGHFRVTVVYYFNDDANRENYPEASLSIFRKRDHQPLLRFVATDLGPRTPLVYTNAVCARFRNLRVSVGRYEAIVQLDPDVYDDPQGYYLTHSSCCRNEGVVNIRYAIQLGPVTSTQIGHIFYLEFPPLKRSGRPFKNTPPRFTQPNGEYACRGEPFRYPFRATDADGDELRYSLVTSLLAGNIPNTGPAPYPSVAWETGFAADNPMPGNPGLRVDPRSGDVSVTPTALGLFAFAVKVEEFRNGQKIGEVRRDFQLLVVDCPTVVPPEPVVSIDGEAPGTTTARLCTGGSVGLRATVNPDWEYQWQRDGLNLPGATEATFVATQPGAYTVVVSLQTRCSRVSTSRTVTITPFSPTAKLFFSGPSKLCFDGGTVTLRAPQPDPAARTTFAYAWFRDGQPQAPTTDSLTVSQPGRYWATVRDLTLGCLAPTDTVVVEQGRPQRAGLVAVGNSVICPDDSVKLTASGGETYRWSRDGQAISGVTSPELTVRRSGVYVVTALDSAGCGAAAPPFRVQAVSGVDLELDSIPRICGTAAPTVALVARPTGGIFSGNGVSGTQFSPRRAGLGAHEVAYTVRVSPQCPVSTVRRWAVVAEAPTIRLPEEIRLPKGSTTLFRPILTGSPVRLTWSPPQFLSSDTVAAPRLSGLETDATYTLTVENAAGCRVGATVRVVVFQKIYLPDVFTPNGDGLNDVWELKGLEEYPRAELRVFDRWGVLVYRSEAPATRPFDGTRDGQPLPTGSYPYTLRPAPGEPVLRGAVVIAR